MPKTAKRKVRSKSKAQNAVEALHLLLLCHEATGGDGTGPNYECAFEAEDMARKLGGHIDNASDADDFARLHALSALRAFGIELPDVPIPRPHPVEIRPLSPKPGSRK